MKRSARQKSREFCAVESLKSAGDAIGEIKKDCQRLKPTNLEKNKNYLKWRRVKRYGRFKK